MEELGKNKQTFLEQVRMLEQQQVKTGSMTQEAFVNQLKLLLAHYSDLKVDEYKGWISDDAYCQLEEAMRDPQERLLWKQIETASEGNLSQIQDKLRLVLDYIARYPNGPKRNEANSLKDRLQGLLDEERERSEWDVLDKSNYHDMRNYKLKYPNSVHKKELDDCMWRCTDKSENQLRRYLDDWDPSGGHVKEARSMLEALQIWNGGTDPKWNDIFELKRFLDANPSFLFINQVKDKYDVLRSKILFDMKSRPGQFRQTDLDKYVSAGIFTREELIREGIKGRDVDPSTLPNLEQFSANPNYEAKEGCTDIYLFGVPGTGKTCLLMGLTGAEGKGYSINFREKGGPYASALQQYVQAGVTPTSTPGKYVTTIRSSIEERREKKGKKADVVMNHNINFVEMSGEEFAHKIANNDLDSVRLIDMGDGTKELLRNNNRKVFFIIIDPTVDVIKFEFKKYEKDENDNIVSVRPVTEYINQQACISKFVDLFEAEENKEFMKRVDAIHFIMTKADTFGSDDEVRKKMARDLMIDKYGGVVTKLIGYCRRSKRVNYATDYHPMVYPFSLGKFYVGGTFEYDKNSTLKIINVLRYNTAAKKEDSFFDKVRDFLA